MERRIEFDGKAWAEEVVTVYAQRHPKRYSWDAVSDLDVARYLGVTASTWCRIRSGKVKPGSAPVAAAFALLGVDPRDYVRMAEGMQLHV